MNHSSSKKFSFYPDEPRERRPRKRVSRDDSWVAPEHKKYASSMKRRYPVNELGERIPGRTRELVVDNRPNVLIPEPDKIYL